MRGLGCVIASVVLVACSRPSPSFDETEGNAATSMAASEGGPGVDSNPQTGGGSGAHTSGADSSTGKPITTGPPPTTGATTDDPTTDTTPTDTDKPPPDQTCCDIHEAPECSDKAISTCVCDHDPFCCDPLMGSWDEFCVEEVDTFGCGDCGLNYDACCTEHLGPGCGVSSVDIACVCALAGDGGILGAAAASCCLENWEPHCVALAVGICQIECPPIGDNCCLGQGDQVGCQDPDILQCVCELDPLCCVETWSFECVDLAINNCGAGCG